MAYIQPLGDLYTYTFIKQGIEMKSFDLEAAKRGEPIVTRNGINATFIAHVPELGELHRVLYTVPNNDYALSCTEDGRHYTNSQSGYDLFMAPKKRTVWVNLYESDPTFGLAGYYATEVAADNYSRRSSLRIGGKAYPVEIEE